MFNSTLTSTGKLNLSLIPTPLPLIDTANPDITDHFLRNPQSSLSQNPQPLLKPSPTSQSPSELNPIDYSFDECPHLTSKSPTSGDFNYRCEATVLPVSLTSLRKMMGK